MDSLRAAGFGPEGDRELVESILRFTKLLLEKCGNRVLYNSGDRLDALLNTTSLSLLQWVLRVGLGLAQRYRDRFRGALHLPPPTKHLYGLDLDKLQILATTFAPPTHVKNRRGPGSPTKPIKGRDKPSPSNRTRRSSSLTNPNDFRMLCKEDLETNGSEQSSSLPNQEWRDWATVTLTYPTSEQASNTADGVSTPAPGEAARPSFGRRTSAPGNSRLRRMSTVEDQVPEVESRAKQQSKDAEPGTLELSSTDLAVSSIQDLLAQHAATLPRSHHFEFLHKLRIGYGLLSSSCQRQMLLSVRLLAMANLTCVTPDETFTKRLFGQDLDIHRRRELIHQLISLLQNTEKTKIQVPFQIQTACLEVLAAMVRQKTTTGEICNALQINSAHGVLLLLTQKALKDLSSENDTSDDLDADDRRDMVFSMVKICIESAALSNRLPDSFIPSSLMSCYIAALDCRSEKGLRVHLRILETFKLFFHYIKDGLAFLSAHNTFEKMAELLEYLTGNALAMLAANTGFPGEFRTPNTDYQIPYVHQQILRSCIDIVNDVSGHQGPAADRVLRGLIDSARLLGAFRTIIMPANVLKFGAHTWSETVKCISGFLNNEPTSFAILAEAELPAYILKNVTGEDLSPEPVMPQSPEPNDSVITNGEMHIASLGPNPPSSSSVRDEKKFFAPQSTADTPAFPASSSVVASLVQAFLAICVTSAGLEMFQKSAAIERFLTIFQSPTYVKAIKPGNTLNLLGQSFDELMRHHPQLRERVTSALMVTAARVRWICKSQAWKTGAGPKLWDPRSTSKEICGGNGAALIEVSPNAEVVLDVEKGYAGFVLPDGNILLPDPARPSIVSDLSFDEHDASGVEPADYISCLVGFFAALFDTQSQCSYWMEHGGTDLILDCMTLSTLPLADIMSGSQNANMNLGVVVHDLADMKPHLVLPVLVQRAQHACAQLQSFVETRSSISESYFAPLMGFDSSGQDYANSKQVLETGTTLAKSFTVLYSHLQTLTEIFSVSAYGSRSSQASLFSQVNLSDLFADLCEKLGAIAVSCLQEALAIQRAMPEDWSKDTSPDCDSVVNEDVRKILGLRNNSSGDLPVNTEAQQTPLSVIDSVSPSTDRMSIDEQSSTPQTQSNREAAMKNAKILRQLMVEIPSTIRMFLSTIGRALVAKRRTDIYQKQNVHRVADAIAQTLCVMLNPPPFAGQPTPDQEKHNLQTHFGYLVCVLDMVNDIILEQHGQVSEQMGGCATVILSPFKTRGGITLLTQIGTAFFEQLKRCEVHHGTIHVMTRANCGLKICLEILDGFTSSLCVTEAQQSVMLKSNDHNRPFYFQPAQLLLELRMEALPLTRLIWNSEYADQASQSIVERLILILKHVMNGDGEGEAYRNAAAQPKISSHPSKQFELDPTRLSELKSSGIDESIAGEALFRCFGHIQAAREYAQSFQQNPTRQRCSVPLDLVVTATSEPSTSTEVSNQAVNLLTSSMNSALADALNSIRNGDVINGIAVDNAPSGENGTSPMRIHNILNGEVPTESADQQSARAVQTNETTMNDNRTFYVEDINKERESIRKDLVERCVNILSSHQALMFELSDLVLSATKRASEDVARSFQRDAASLLIQSLLSLQSSDQIDEPAGKKIAAFAHLNALLLQDKAFYEGAEDFLHEEFEQLVSFLRLPPQNGRTAELSFPWVGPILLLFERLLARDAEPAVVEWRTPQDLEKPSEAKFFKVDALGDGRKQQLFQTLVDMLPRIGKDPGLALSVCRIFVMLTRSKELALQLAQKRNIQRLLVMVKQLPGGADERLHSSIMIILRHIIEDDKILRQIMKSEILSHFNQRPTPRSIDVNSFVRDVHHLSLRNAGIFVDVANELVKIQKWEGREQKSLVLRKVETDAHVNGQPASTEPPLSHDVIGEANADLELSRERFRFCAGRVHGV